MVKENFDRTEAKKAVIDFVRQLAVEITAYEPGQEALAENHLTVRLTEWRDSLIEGGLAPREANIIVSGASAMISAAISLADEPDVPDGQPMH